MNTCTKETKDIDTKTVERFRGPSTEERPYGRPEEEATPICKSPRTTCTRRKRMPHWGMDKEIANCAIVIQRGESCDRQ